MDSASPFERPTSDTASPLGEVYAQLGIELTPWQVEIIEGLLTASERALERTFRGEPVDLDTWEGEGGSLAPRPLSWRRMRGIAADLIILDEVFEFSAEQDAVARERLAALPDATMTVPGGADSGFPSGGCQGCFADAVDESWEPPPACTRYPVCDDPELPDDEACIWPNCAIDEESDED